MRDKSFFLIRKPYFLAPIIFCEMRIQYQTFKYITTGRLNMNESPKAYSMN